jgi:glycosyltransferase involved in cell wall biosynthesis
VVLPYKKIDHSGIVHLAYSFGRPIIATDVGDFKEMIEQDNSGYIVPNESIVSLAQTLERALIDMTSLSKMGQSAQALSRTKYSWSNIGFKTKAIYQTSLS